MAFIFPNLTKHGIQFQIGDDLDSLQNNMAVRRQKRSSSYFAVLMIFTIAINRRSRYSVSALNTAGESVGKREGSLSYIDFNRLYWFLSQDRGVGRHLGVGGLNGLLLRHSKTLLHAFCLLLILLSGDMCVYNAGPPQYPCGKCKKGVRKKSKGYLL